MFLSNNTIGTQKALTGKQVFFDLFALSLVFGLFMLIAFAAKQLSLNISYYEHFTLSLSPSELPYYALMTTMRIFSAVMVSLIFTLIVATLAAKNKRAEQIILPILDILQSIPVLGYISFTVTFFIHLNPSKTLGIELAVIFAIFTAQVWNMTFSVYQSLKTVPKDLLEASESFNLSPWEKYWRIEVPFAIPGLVWNTMMSVSASWFFIVASEAISVGNIQYTLPGVGAYLATAIEQKDIRAVIYTILVMLLLIMLYNYAIFKPILTWAEKFKYESSATRNPHSSWLFELLARSYLFSKIGKIMNFLIKKFVSYKLFTKSSRFFEHSSSIRPQPSSKSFDIIWYFTLCLIMSFCLITIYNFLFEEITLQEVRQVIFLGFITFAKIIVLIFAAAIILVPLGVYIGLRPVLTARIQPLIQFLAAFPANILFPIFVIFILHYKLNIDVFLSPLMILGAQWYILFNVIAGAAAFPVELQDSAQLFRINGLRWWRKVIIPGIFPYLITGMITATGAAWNASIVAEAVSWGNTHIYATGLGAYLAEKTLRGDFHHIVLGIFIMALYVVLTNRLVWRPLYNYAETKMRLE
jgi:NitT/TauT family transport system permease protein